MADREEQKLFWGIEPPGQRLPLHPPCSPAATRRRPRMSSGRRLSWKAMARSSRYARPRRAKKLFRSLPTNVSSGIGAAWRWDGNGYVWVAGHYIERPTAQAVWEPGHWVDHGGGWVWDEGHWRA